MPGLEKPQAGNAHAVHFFQYFFSPVVKRPTRWNSSDLDLITEEEL